MALINAKRLRKAKFNGVEFSFQSSTVESGRKTKTHEFPNSDIRIVEDLGLMVPKYKITAIVDINFLFNKDALITELQKGGEGTLVHPVYGYVKCSVIKYTARDDIKSLGATFYDIELLQSELPLPAFQALGSLGSKVSALQQAQQLIGKTLFLIAKSQAAFNRAVDKVQSVADLLQVISKTVSGAGDGIVSLNNALIDLKNNANSFVNSPDTLFDTLTTSVNNLSAAYGDDSADSSESLDEVSASNESDDTLTGTSPNIRQQDLNQQLINIQLRLCSLSLNYQVASEREYTHLDELNRRRALLEAEYQNLSPNLDDDILEGLNELRHLANINFDNIAIILARIVTIHTEPTNLTSLCYSIYGSLDNVDFIIGLNNLTDVSRVEGSIKILTQ